MVDATIGIVTVYNNIGIITGLLASIFGTIYTYISSHFKHSKHSILIGKIAEYLNEAHSFTTENHDKFVGLVQAATDINPQLKNTLEAHGSDINKVVADSEIGKQKLTKVLAEVNALTTLLAQKK